jgi:hypothetical protein
MLRLPDRVGTRRRSEICFYRRTQALRTSSLRESGLKA